MNDANPNPGPGRASRPPKRTPGAEAGSQARKTPEELRREIERTRKHMDSVLSELGEKLRPRPKVKAALLAFAAIALPLAGWALWYLLAVRRKSRHAASKGWRWRGSGALEQALLAGKLVAAARKGSPAIIVVEPRRT
jgi:hypothetical protein